MSTRKEEVAARRRRTQWLLWWCWVGASAAGELVALPLAALLVSTAIGHASNGGSLLPLAAGALAGMVNGAMVGGLQWLALRRTVQQFSGWRWTLATALGTALPWALGMSMRSSLSLSQGNDEAVLGAMLLLGVLTGVALGGAQWLVLRRILRQAGWWIPASILAWLQGLVVLMSGASLIQTQTPLWSLLLISGVTGLVIGSLVGIITGIALVGLTSVHVVRSYILSREPQPHARITAPSRPVALELMGAKEN